MHVYSVDSRKKNLTYGRHSIHSFTDQELHEVRIQMFLSLEFPYNIFVFLSSSVWLFLQLFLLASFSSSSFNGKTISPCGSIFRQEGDNQIDPTHLIDYNEELAQILGTPPVRRIAFLSQSTHLNVHSLNSTFGATDRKKKKRRIGWCWNSRWPLILPNFGGLFL